MAAPTFRRLVDRYRSDRTQRRAPGRRGTTTAPDRGDEGLTLVELLVAFAALMVLMGIAGTALTTYLTAGTTVISSYSATDQLLPSSIVIQRLIRSEVEPAPTPTAATSCAAVNAPCPPFLTGSAGASSTTFFANVGDPAGPALIVMAESAPTKCASCRFYSSVFTVTQYAAKSGTCPFSQTATTFCHYQLAVPFQAADATAPAPAPKVLVDIPNLINGQAGLPDPTKPVFTYNTLDPYSTAYTPGVTGFTTCNAPTTDANGVPTSSNCPPDDIQSVGVDLEVQVQGSPSQENSFLVYRLSSSSYLYSPLVG